MTTEVTIAEQHLPEAKTTFDEDNELARNIIKDTIHELTKECGELEDLAFSSQQPRMHEVYLQAVNARVSAAKDLVNLHKTRKDVTGREQAPVSQEIHQQLNLTMTTAQFLDMVTKQTEETKEIGYK